MASRAGQSGSRRVGGRLLSRSASIVCNFLRLSRGICPEDLVGISKELEMHRVLKPEGALAVWLFPPVVHFWVPKSILQSGLFTYMNKRNGVYNYKRCQGRGM